MGYCHKCEHDCTEKDPCPCCRTKDNDKNKGKFIPWTPSPYTNPYIIPYTEPPFNPIKYPREYPKPLRPLREYWCHPDIKPQGYKTVTTTRMK